MVNTNTWETSARRVTWQHDGEREQRTRTRPLIGTVVKQRVVQQRSKRTHKLLFLFVVNDRDNSNQKTWQRRNQTKWTHFALQCFDVFYECLPRIWFVVALAIFVSISIIETTIIVNNKETEKKTRHNYNNNNNNNKSITLLDCRGHHSTPTISPPLNTSTCNIGLVLLLTNCDSCEMLPVF